MAGGAGGAGGWPNGQAGAGGEDGTNDYSSTRGGNGGSSPLGTGGDSPTFDNPTGKPGQGFGAGGSGASATDRVSPFNWAGGDGSPGYVAINW